MDKFEKFLDDVKGADPKVESVGHLYSQLRNGQLYKPLVLPDSVRSVTVDPRSGTANKMITPSIDAMGAPTCHCTSSMGSTKSNTLTEPMPENKSHKPQQIKTTPNKQIQELMKNSPANHVKPVEFTKTYSEQVPVCGYSVKTGSTGLTGSYVQGTDAGYSTSGTSTSSSSAT